MTGTPARDRERQDRAIELLLDFARNTGLDPVSSFPRRYLWTDAFAVCTFLGLSGTTGDRVWQDRALGLISQVHDTLGRHRSDDERTGWISGLAPEEGRQHPVAGGLRIGKPLAERRAHDPYREDEEWDRDGQYFHYLTKWMHALAMAAKSTGDPVFAGWAAELARTAYRGFVVPPAPGVPGRMYWKMSIDLTRPLVSSMGQHDPLDGLVTCREVRAAFASANPGASPVLGREMEGFSAIGRSLPLATADALGTGGLLFDASRIARLATADGPVSPELLERVLDAALSGLRSFTLGGTLDRPAEDRLAFRECGLSLGLAGADLMPSWIRGNPALAGRAGTLLYKVEEIRHYLPMRENIEDFWLNKQNQLSATWQEHRDINGVTLATSLAPAGFLSV
jgi:hypothetical protein